MTTDTIQQYHEEALVRAENALTENLARMQARQEEHHAALTKLAALRERLAEGDDSVSVKVLSDAQTQVSRTEALLTHAESEVGVAQRHYRMCLGLAEPDLAHAIAELVGDGTPLGLPGLVSVVWPFDTEPEPFESGMRLLIRQAGPPEADPNEGHISGLVNVVLTVPEAFGVDARDLVAKMSRLAERRRKDPFVIKRGRVIPMAKFGEPPAGYRNVEANLAIKYLYPKLPVLPDETQEFRVVNSLKAFCERLRDEVGQNTVYNGVRAGRSGFAGYTSNVFVTPSEVKLVSQRVNAEGIRERVIDVDIAVQSHQRRVQDLDQHVRRILPSFVEGRVLGGVGRIDSFTMKATNPVPQGRAYSLRLILVSGRK